MSAPPSTMRRFTFFGSDLSYQASFPATQLDGGSRQLQEMNGQETHFAVSIISNSRLLGEALVVALANYASMYITGRYSDMMCSVELPLDLPDHVVLLDGNIGCESLVRWAQHLRSQTTPPHVIVFELLHDTEVILACIEAGAGGYVLQGASIAELVETITLVRHGRACCSTEVTGRLFARVARLSASTLPPSPIEMLTSREREVLNCLMKDFSNQEIAAALVIEVNTVKNHMHRILEKLKVKHRDEAARIAAEHGWRGSDMQ